MHQPQLKITLAIAALFVFAAPAVQTASACPMCKLANEESEDKAGVGAQTVNNKPEAYMYSILFMIGMPVTLFSIFGLLFWRMVRKAQRELDANALAATETGLDGEAGFSPVSSPAPS